METLIEISVLITTYNLEKYIEKTLNSVLKQKTTFNYEILIGDDGSTDSTLNIVKKISKDSNINIKIYKNFRDNNKQYNPIYRASRNRLNLLKHAKGNFVTFLDGDDFYLSDNLLQKEYNILLHNKNCVMCGCDIIFYYESKKGGIRVNGNCLSEGLIPRRKYWRKYWIPAECFLYRNIYKYKKKITMNNNVFDDNLIVFYFMQYGNIYYINEAMVAYRQNRTVWKKKNRLEQSLYNAMDIYEEIRINYKMFLEIFTRHFKDLRILFDNMPKLQIDSFNKERFICKKNNYQILYWMLSYKKISIFQKLVLYLLKFYISFIGNIYDFIVCF